MLGTMKKFFADRKGAFAMQFALLVVPLTVCTGLAIDGGRAFLARYELASALDAAALAVGSTTHEDSDLNEIAHSFVNANFHTPHNGDIDLELDTESEGEVDIVLLRGTVTIDTYFMPLVGQPTVTVSAESQVRRGGANVEVALALDITSSMTMGVDRMTPLKAAAKDLINTVVTDTQTPFYSRVAIVPWGSAVHVGNMADDLRGEVTGPVTITGADWRNGPVRTISNSASTGWRKNVGGNGISNVTWRNGTAKGITSISKIADGHILVRTSTNHSYSNGDTVYVSGAGGSFAFLSGNRYRVADRTTTSPYTFELQDAETGVYINAPSGTVTAWTGGGTSQRCFNAACEIRVTTSSNNAFVAGDHIHISGVGSPYGAANNANDSPWTVSSAPTTTTFLLLGSNGPAITSTSSAASGTASECFTSTCKFQVTATGHGFSDGEFVSITGATLASGGSSTGTSINTASGVTWTVENATANTFTLPGNGQSYRDHAGGSAQRCFTDTCEVRVTAAGHGLTNSQYTQISGVNGLTALNQSGNTSWQVEEVSGDTFILSGTNNSSTYSTLYTSGGQSQCLVNGCAKYRYTKSGGGVVIKPISNCVSERTGAEAATDAGPESAPLGRYYPAGGYNVCGTANWIAPLTDHKESLRDHIDDLVVSGSTAGQVGVAWGWYMLSENWTMWDTFATDKDDAYSDVTYFAPALNDEPNTSKVLILMTDGDFNTAHCNGVASSNYAITNSSDVINCPATNGAPFTQAQTLCDAIDPDDDDRMLVFTIGFEIAADGDAADFLRECASKPEYFFLSEDGTDLQADFKKIAKEISKLRIAR